MSQRERSRRGWAWISIALLVVLSAGCGQAVMRARLNKFEKGYDQRLRIVTETFPPAKPQVPYETRIEVQGGVAPYRWEIQQGRLPEGLSLDASTGRIAGTPRTREKQVVLVKVRDTSNDLARGTLIRSFVVDVE